MNVFLLIVFGLFGANFAWWLWADARLRGHDRAKARPWRVLVGVLALSMAALFLLVIYGRVRDWDNVLPRGALMAVYVWHIVVLPVVLVSFLVASAAATVRAAFRALSAKPVPVTASVLTDPVVPVGPTRRQVLATALVAAGPPLLQVAGVTTAAFELGQFRVRRFDIGFKNLPAALDGVTIAHLSDTHLGRFTTRDDVRHIVQATNKLDVDVVAFTGDLIDFDIDALPEGLALLQGLKARSGVVTVEGNHDLFQDRDRFERGIKDAGLPLLLNEQHTVRVGRAGHPMQFLGLQWGTGATRRDANLEAWSAVTLAQRNPDVFNVLLGHHPHAFDFAADAGVPLTLAGHTHGGQLMLTPNLGPGPLMYRYWSGLYAKPGRNAACVVSNGIGNWFPLRINAPAEIVHITLKQA